MIFFNKIKNYFSTKDNTLQKTDVNIMTEEFIIESPLVYRDVLLKVPKAMLQSSIMTPLLCCPVISDFEAIESLEKNYKEFDNPCGINLPKIVATYYLPHKDISAGVYYNISLLQETNVRAFVEDFFTILPFEYCGYKYLPNPTYKDFQVNLEVIKTPLNPVGETEEYYLYQVKVKGNISLILYVIVDPNDVNTLNQLNTALGKSADNNVFSLRELSTINDLSYNSVDISSIDKGIFRYLSNLKNLSMTNCYMDTIFQALFGLVSLESLNLSNNDLEILTDDFEHLYNLQTLYMNNNKLKNLSTFNDMNIIVYAENQEINFGTIDKSTTSNKYELDFSFLRDCNNKVPNVTSTSGVISGNTIIWEDTLSGSTVSFQFSNNERFLGSVSVDLSNKNNYEIDSNGVITKFTPINPYVKDINIPRYINGIEVKAIGDYAFKWAFVSAYLYPNVTIPDSVTTIGEGAFYRCDSLNSVIIPNSVTTIGAYAFYNCGALKSVNIPKGVTTIEKYTFYNCQSLEGVIIPDSVISIGIYAFYGCFTLLYINIPSNVISIGESAFGMCIYLWNIDISEGVDSIGDMAFIDSSGLMAVTIPNSVTAMGTYVFLRCVGLTSVTIPYRLSTFNQYLFSECSNVNSLTIVASSQEIDPNSSLEQLLQTWTNWANNLSLNNIGSIAGKYLVIDGATIDLS